MIDIGMTNIADAVVRRIILGIIQTADRPGEGDGRLFQRFAKQAVGCHRDVVLDHVDVAVTVRIVAIPAELAPLPLTGIQVSLPVLVAEVSGTGLARSGNKTGSWIETDLVGIIGRITGPGVAAVTTIVVIIIVALQTDAHHHVLIFDVGLLQGCPTAGIGVVATDIIDMAGRGAGGHAGMVSRCDDGIDLGGQTACGIVTPKAFGIVPLHVTVDTLFLEAIFKLCMDLQPIRVAPIFMDCGPVVTVPTWVVGREIGRWVARNRIGASSGRPTVTAGFPFGHIDPRLSPVEGIVIIDIEPGGAVTGQTLDATAPDRVFIGAAVTGGIGTALGDRVIAAAILEDHIF